jgi:hypothetical protein
MTAPSPRSLLDRSPSPWDRRCRRCGRGIVGAVRNEARSRPFRPRDDRAFVCVECHGARVEVWRRRARARRQAARATRGTRTVCCEACGKVMTTQRSTRKWCSPRCRVAGWRRNSKANPRDDGTMQDSVTPVDAGGSDR